MSHILLYLSSTIIVLKKDNYCRQQVDNICRRQYLSSTGWLKAGYGLVMMMMMIVIEMFMTIQMMIAMMEMITIIMRQCGKPIF